MANITNLEPHEQRVFTERDELQQKITKLSLFKDSPKWGGVEPLEQELLLIQLSIMCSYRDMLNLRISFFAAKRDARK
jgi:hypothetical protein